MLIINLLIKIFYLYAIANFDAADDSNSDDIRNLSYESGMAIKLLKNLSENDGVWDVHVAICAEVVSL